MNKHLPLLLTAILLFSACKKDQPATNPVLTGTILLSGISDNNSKPLAHFTYSGKMLSKAVLTDGTFAETHQFNYDSQGNLTGSTITCVDPAYAGDTGSAITYSSGNISEIKFYKANSVLDQDITFVYAGGKLSSWTNTMYAGGALNGQIYTAYYFTGNNCTELTSALNVYGADITPSTFDTQNSLNTAFPQYLYFAANIIQSHPCIPQIPGLNNPTTYGTYLGMGAHLGATVTYTYNANNYPSSANLVAFTYTANISRLYTINTAAIQYNYSYIGVQ